MNYKTHIGNGIYSHLSPRQLKELRRCIDLAFPEFNREGQYIRLACQPEAAKRFMSHSHFRQEKQQALELN